MACLSANKTIDMKEFTVFWQKCDWQGINYIVANKGYDYSAVRNQICTADRIPVIPRKKGAICPVVRDKEGYKTRSAIERLLEN
ncbi:hypothetical protein [Legionella pneumophila]|uniref:hypothetical protein n=1 Tax=Legionella pneumophila TaxID=446 RepID=UPI00026D9A9A|nr:hypothetical protein [Legionella pneumophila]CCD09561.1 protein of unknown function [Legionella pneumophila subsp. pneumophila]CZI77989.1 Uncharacterised protein [Legionella pneumophila]CZQ86391.1 Uncharacterised protein [Legionella pneumophila]STX66744.1 Uncharacterised protein [Legionella pneumophila]HAT1802958.1 hypothetical protein [Legionella pneumophila]